MKVSQEKVFKPVTIVLENETEYLQLIRCLRFVENNTHETDNLHSWSSIARGRIENLN